MTDIDLEDINAARDANIAGGDILFRSYYLLGKPDPRIGLFDQYFLVAYWAPVFMAACLAAFGMYVIIGWRLLSSFEISLDIGVFILFIALIAITILANLLQAFTNSIVSFYRGHWPKFFWQVLENFEKNEVNKKYKEFSYLSEMYLSKKIKSKDEETIKHLDKRLRLLNEELLYLYPSKIELVKATKLGNVLEAADDYSRAKYGMDRFWWLRLFRLLPEPDRFDIRASLAPLLCLLNFASILAVISIGIFTYLIYVLVYIPGILAYEHQISFQLTHINYIYKELVFLAIIGLCIAYAAYFCAIAQSRVYGEKTRVTVDLHRLKLLNILLSDPSMSLNIENERDQWERVTAGNHIESDKINQKFREMEYFG